MTTLPVSYRERQFQLWAFSVSMKRLLLRSTKTPTWQTRVDVLFRNVEGIELPTELAGLVVDVAPQQDWVPTAARLGVFLEEHLRVYAVSTSRQTGYVIAGLIWISEDQGEHYEPSDVWFEPES